GAMGLVTPFDSSFWSTEEAPPSPEGRSAKKQADYNQKMWGSPSVSVKYDSDGHQVFWSGITGNGYGTAAEAVADEAAYKQDPRAWAQANSAAAQQMTAATGAQTPVANPNAPTNQILDGLGIYGSPGSGTAPTTPVLDTPSIADRRRAAL